MLTEWERDGANLAVLFATKVVLKHSLRHATHEAHLWEGGREGGREERGRREGGGKEGRGRKEQGAMIYTYEYDHLYIYLALYIPYMQT